MAQDAAERRVRGQIFGRRRLRIFRLPQAHEDDAERAVCAGLELIAAVATSVAHFRYRTRVGIATELVVVGDLIGTGSAQEQAIVGDRAYRSLQ
jgi:hypothetical protein